MIALPRPGTDLETKGEKDMYTQGIVLLFCKAVASQETTESLPIYPRTYSHTIPCHEYHQEIESRHCSQGRNSTASRENVDRARLKQKLLVSLTPQHRKLEYKA